MRTCARPGCDNPLKTGTTYCSASCAAQVREASKKSIHRLGEKLEAAIGSEASNLVVDEVGRYLMEGQVPAALTEGITYGQWALSLDGTKDYRPDDRLSYDKIDLMLKNGSVIFAMMMKMAQIMRVFSEGRYKVESPDEELRQVADAALRFILSKMSQDFCWSSFAYGTSFQEEVWEWKSKYALGLSKSKAAGTEFQVPKVPNSVHPKTVDHIRRDSKQRFNGFAQTKQVWFTDSQFNIVERDAALVIPLNERFRNLWGESFLTAIYPLWIWYEIVLRTMARYLERQAMPVTVGRAPMRGTVNVNGKTEPVGAMDLILSVATNVAKSSAVAIPSDRDPETKEYLFDLDYLVSAERGGEFIKALEFLGQEMIKAGLSADRSLTQSSGGVGSYNIGEVHAEASATTALMIELQFLFYLNKYFMPGFSLYNRGTSGPPIWLRTQSIDMQERQLLMQLVGVAGNSEGGQEFFKMIDFRTMGDMSNIPILSEADVKKQAEERQQQSLDNQEAQQKMMMKYADVSKPAIPSKKPEPQGGKFEEAMAALYKLEQMPWILGPSDIETLRLHGLITDDQYQLFNPAHDSLGRFASRAGGAIKSYSKTPGGRAVGSGFAGGGVPGGASAAILHHKFGVAPAKAGNIGGFIGGGLAGYIGSKVTNRSLDRGRGMASSIIRGMGTFIVADAAIGVAVVAVAIAADRIIPKDDLDDIKEVTDRGDIGLEQADDVYFGIIAAVIEAAMKMPDNPEYLLIDTGTITIGDFKKIDGYYIIPLSEAVRLEHYQLFNPIHETATGRFASRRGGGGAGDGKSGVINSQERKQAIGQARAGGGFLTTAGKVLGLTALGAVGLAVIGSIPVEAQEPPEIDPDLINRIKEAKEAEKSGELDTSNWPRANSTEELQRQVTEMLKAGGVSDIPADLQIVVDDSRLPPGTGGAYFGDTNTYVIRGSYLAKIGDGDPNAYWATIHEIAHSAQETQAEGNNNGFLINIDDADGSFRGYFEGQNDLTTAITMTRTYGQPMDHQAASSMSAELARQNTGIGFASVVGYPEETAAWAGVAKAWESKTGENAIDFTVRAHNEGLNTGWQRDNVMYELFPEKMGAYQDSWPPTNVIVQWLKDDYSVDTSQAFSEMLEDALSG